MNQVLDDSGAPAPDAPADSPFPAIDGGVDAAPDAWSAVDGATVDASDGAVATASVEGWPFADGRASHPSPGHIEINIQTVAATCATAANRDYTPASSTTLSLDFNTPGGDPSPGSYPLSPNGTPQVFAQTTARDGACAMTRSNIADSSGTLTITSIGSSISGRFDVSIGAAHYAGSFDVPACAGAPDGGGGACH